MKCSSCSHRYPANGKAGLNGKFAAPGKLFLATLAFFALDVFLFSVSVDLWFGIALLATAICAYSLWESWNLANQHSPTCPRCGHPNRVQPWSL